MNTGEGFFYRIPLFRKTNKVVEAPSGCNGSFLKITISDVNDETALQVIYVSVSIFGLLLVVKNRKQER